MISLAEGNATDESNNPLISILIPAYNSAAFIAKTVNSVLSQDCTDFEIIVIDDGSTDQTAQVIESCFASDHRVKLISKENSGVSAARNTGIDAARGEYLCFLDSDDIIEANFISLMTDKIATTNTDLTYCGYLKWGERTADRCPKMFSDEDALRKYITGDIFFGMGSFIVRKAFLLQNCLRFDEQLKLSEDVLFICSVLCLAKVSFVDQYLHQYIYRQTSAMNSQWNEAKHLQDIDALAHVNASVSKLYQGDNKVEIIRLLERNLTERKVSFLWKMLLSKKFKDLDNYVRTGFLTAPEIANLSYCRRKNSKKIRKKAQYILSANKFIWRIICMVHNKIKDPF